MSQALRLRLCDSILCWFSQSAYSLCLIPLFQQTSQGREESLLLIVHAATVQLMGIRVPVDVHALYKLPPKIILVCSQHCFQGIVQKLQILLQLA